MSDIEPTRRDVRVVVVAGLVLAVSAMVLPLFPTVLWWVNLVATVVGGVVLLWVIGIVVRDVWL